MTVPFVGREAELRALSELVVRAKREGAPAAGLIQGEPGTGKSRLLREVVAGLDPGRTVVVAGFEPTQPVPFAALGDLLRRLATVPDHGARLDALTFGAGASAQGALAVFEAAHRAQAAFGPLVVAVDDLQWVDAQSLGLLHYLVSAAESTGRPLSVIAAARPSPAGAAFGGGIGGPLPERRRLSIELRGLPLAAGVALMRSIDEQLEPPVAEELWHRAAGIPFWLEALARGEGAGGAMNVVTDRLRALSIDAGALLNTLAIGARPFGSSELVGVLDWPPERLDQAARELVGRGLAIDGHGTTLRLAHDLIRETAARAVPPGASRTIHARIADELERAAGSDLHLLSEALDHRTAAGSPPADLAVRILESPGRRLIGGNELRRLSAIADGLAAGSDARMAIDMGVGKLAGIVGDHELARRHWLRIADAATSPAARQRAAWESALAAFRLGRAGEAHEHLDRAHAAAPDSLEGVAAIEALRAEIALWLDHDTPAGAAAAARALAAARAAVEAAGGLDRLAVAGRQAFVSSLEASIGAAMQEERFDDVRRFSSEILPAARAIDDEAFVAALLRSGFALRPLGALDEAHAAYREAWDIAHRVVLPFPMIDAGIGLARALRDLGRLDEARDIALETVDLEARLGSPPGRWGNALAMLHAADLSIGDPAGLAGLRTDATSHPNAHFRIAIHQLIALWQARTGGRRFEAEIESELEAGRADAERAGCPRCGAELAVVGAEALARIGRPEAAKAELDAWDARPIAEYPMREYWRMRAKASIAAAEDDHAGAASILDGLAGALGQLGLLDELAWLQLDAGGAAAHIDRDLAVQWYTAAAAMAERIGAPARARLAARALRQLGVRAWRREPRPESSDSIADLSRREGEIAGLVAGGATNLEIADTLAISPRTVERHVTNILAKLGARNRTELAARLGSSGTGFPR